MKRVSLNKDSWHFKYYSWIIGSDAPKTLCPYFWTMVAIVSLAPIVVFFKLLGMLGSYLEKRSDAKILKKFKDPNYDPDKEYEKMKKREKIGEITGKIALGFLILFAMFVIGVVFYESSTKYGWFEVLKNLMAIIGLITVFLLSIFGLMELQLGRRIANSNFIQVPKSMIIAVYTKACPLVEWNDNKLAEIKQ
jgi:hypothetical protein